MQPRAVGAAVAAAALAGCAGGAARVAATNRVDLPRSYSYAPAAITVAAGTRVTWVNHDVFTHSVRLREIGDSDQVLRPGDSASYTFSRPGLYHYDCIFHTQMMKGTVRVTGP